MAGKGRNMKWIDNTLGGMLDEQARSYGDKELLVTRESSVTYRGAKEKTEALAKGLLDIGVKKGENVVVWMSNCLEWVYSVFALAKIGACSVPLNTRFKAREAEYILRQSDCGTLVFADRLLKVDFTQMAYELLPELSHSPPGELRSERFPRLRRVICAGDKRYNGMFDLTSLIEPGAQRKKQTIQDVQASTKGEDIGMIQYTSGTTAFPKGAMLRHGAMLQDGFFVGERWLMTDEDRLFSVAPFYHNAGSVLALLNAMTHGATMYTLPYWNVEDALEVIHKHRCTIFAARPTLISDILEFRNVSSYDLSSLRLVHESGSPEFRQMTHERFGVEICSVYGLTEASPNVCEGDLRDPLEKRIMFQGKPHPGVEIQIVDLETAETLRPGETGEICIRGWSVMKGYYNKPEETAKAIDGEGWLHTGDLGVLDEDGYLTFKGRIKNLIRCAGENVSAEDVEGFLRSHPKIKEAQIIGVPDTRMGEVVLALVELRTGQQCSENEVIDFCKAKIANFKVPRYVRFVEGWPMTGSGKIQRAKLKEMVDENLKVQ